MPGDIGAAGGATSVDSATDSATPPHGDPTREAALDGAAANDIETSSDFDGPAEDGHSDDESGNGDEPDSEQ